MTFILNPTEKFDNFVSDCVTKNTIQQLEDIIRNPNANEEDLKAYEIPSDKWYEGLKIALAIKKEQPMSALFLSLTNPVNKKV